MLSRGEENTFLNVNHGVNAGRKRQSVNDERKRNR